MARTRASLRILLPWLAVLLLSPGAFAAEYESAVELRLLIDGSAGMLRSDPDGHRLEALDLALRVLPAEVNAGLWVFGDEVHELAAPGSVDASWRSQALAALADATGADFGSYRNIPGALETALSDLDSPAGNTSTSIILVTDGRVDIAPSPMRNAGAARAMLEELAPRLKDRGIAVHTIALSEHADASFLRAFAEATGGHAASAAVATELPLRLFEMIERVAPLVRLPVKKGVFEVDSSVEAFSLLLQGSGADTDTLQAPDPASVGTRERYADGSLTLLSYGQPASGSWKLQPAYTGTVVALAHSDLAVQTDRPPYSSVATGEPPRIKLRLASKGSAQPLAGAAFSGELSGPGDYRRKLGAVDFAVLPEGEFLLQLPPLENPGEYRLRLLASHEASRRERILYFSALAPLDQPTLSTRGQTPLQDEFRLPLLLLATSVAIGLLILWAVLRRRKRRKLEIWRKRAEQLQASANSGLFQRPTALGDAKGQPLDRHSASE